MATIEPDERKRPLDAGPHKASKRPHLDRASSSHRASGPPYDTKAVSQDDEGDDDSIPAYKGLETYRKEAIFRQMREAQRDRARSEAKAQELQGLMREAEQRNAALSHFWNLLVEDVQIMLREDQLEGRRTKLLDAISLDVASLSTPTLTTSLRERSDMIKTLLQWIVNLTPGASPETDELQARCHKLAEEALNLRVQLTSLVSEKATLVEELDRVSHCLRRAEKKFDRVHSASVKTAEQSGAEKQEEAERAKVKAAEAEEKVAIQRREQAESSMEAIKPANGDSTSVLSDELEEVRHLADGRFRELDELRSELVRLRHDNDRLKESVHRVSDEQIAASPIYRELHNHFEHAKEEHARITKLGEQLQAENSELREMRVQFEQKAKAEANAFVDELRNAVKTHEADVARLRGQRDEAQADVSERKQREAVRKTEIEHLKELVKTKDLRIATLKSEVRRVQLAFATKSEDEKLMLQLRSSGGDADDVEIMSDLQARLKAAEDISKDLQRQLDARSSSTSEQDLAARVASLQSELDKLSESLGVTEGAAVSPDEARKRFTDQHEELERLRQELTTANASTAALCDELDKLGEAYSESQKVASVRIAEIGRMEEKVGRLATEKGKADNKYFSAMRAKDALENERRVAMRNVERQARVIEQFGEAEKAYHTQLQHNTMEATRLRALTNELTAKVAEQQRDLQSVLERQRLASQAQERAEAASRQHIEEFGGENRARIEAQERCDKLQRDLDKCRKQLAAAGSSARKKTSGDDDASQADYLNALLTCSTCKERYRNRIILRCLHTFCNECVDARIQTRQRKCPSCGLGFSTSEVQTLYLQ